MVSQISGSNPIFVDKFIFFCEPGDVLVLWIKRNTADGTFDFAPASFGIILAFFICQFVAFDLDHHASLRNVKRGKTKWKIEEEEIELKTPAVHFHSFNTDDTLISINLLSLFLLIPLRELAFLKSDALHFLGGIDG